MHATPDAGELDLATLVEPSIELQVSFEQDMEMYAEVGDRKGLESVRFRYAIMRIANQNRNTDNTITMSPRCAEQLKWEYKDRYDLKIDIPPWVVFSGDLNDKYLHEAYDWVFMTPTEWWRFVVDITNLSKSDPV